LTGVDKMGINMGKMEDYRMLGGADLEAGKESRG
jgi:hypothetical protein